MAEKRREIELTHQGVGKLVKGIGKNDYLEARSEPIQEVFCAFERRHARDDLLDFVYAQPMLFEQPQPLAHEYVIVGNIPGRCA